MTVPLMLIGSGVLLLCIAGRLYYRLVKSIEDDHPLRASAACSGPKQAQRENAPAAARPPGPDALTYVRAALFIADD